MLTTEQMAQLKQVNVSKDAAVTMERVKKDFTAASNALKNEIVELSGQKRSAYYRVFKKGMINARLLLAMSSVLNVTPFYYTGETDDRKACTNKEINEFLQNHEYFELMTQAEPKQKKSRKNNNENSFEKQSDMENAHNSDLFDDDDDESISFGNESGHTHVCDECGEDLDDDDLLFGDYEDSIICKLALPDSDKFNGEADALTEEDATMLLKALYRRARAGGEAEQLVEIVKRCLLL